MRVEDTDMSGETGPKTDLEPFSQLNALQCKKRGTNAAQATIPLPYFGNERKMRKPDKTASTIFTGTTFQFIPASINRFQTADMIVPHTAHAPVESCWTAVEIFIHGVRCASKRKRGLTIAGQPPIGMAGSMGLEPTASGVTGRRYNQLNYDPETQLISLLLKTGATVCSDADWAALMSF